jgi:hypothetical protein
MQRIFPARPHSQRPALDGARHACREAVAGIPRRHQRVGVWASLVWNVAAVLLCACDEQYGPPITQSSDAAVLACPAPEDESTDDAEDAAQSVDESDAAADAGLDDGGNDAGTASTSDAGRRDGGQATQTGRDAGVSTQPSIDAATPTPDAASAPSDAGASTDGGLGDPLTCAPCETQKTPQDSVCANVRAACLQATGTAAKGPKASAPKATLCAELLSCVWTTGCAYSAATNSNDDAQCLCGKDKGSDCLIMSEVPVQGACKDQIYAAAESTDRGELANRFTDVTFAVGLAFQVIDCDSLFCGPECGLSKAADAGP